MEKRKLLFTGASGFLGKNIYQLLSQNFEIDTIGLSDTDTYNIDLSKELANFKNRYHIVLHAAGKAHSVPKSGIETQEFFSVNVKGTKNLCTSLERIGLPDAFIFISTVAVYGLDSGEGITEDFDLKGTSPYALSKIQAERYLSDWSSQNKITLGIIRPALIAGHNAPGNLGSMIQGIRTGRYLRIGDGRARKSILMAEDIARIIPNLSAIGGIYNLCDDHHPSFAELESLILSQLGKHIIITIPLWLARLLALSGDMLGEKFPLNSGKLTKIVSSLTFSNERAKRALSWEPLDVLSNFRI